MIFACPKSPVFSKIILKDWKKNSDIGLETLTNGKNPKLPIFSKVCKKLRCRARGLFQVLQKSLIWVKATFWTKAKLEYVVRLIGSDITKTFITNKSIASLDTWSIHNSRHLSFCKMLIITRSFPHYWIFLTDSWNDCFVNWAELTRIL